MGRIAIAEGFVLAALVCVTGFGCSDGAGDDGNGAREIPVDSGGPAGDGSSVGGDGGDDGDVFDGGGDAVDTNSTETSDGGESDDVRDASGASVEHVWTRLVGTGGEDGVTDVATDGEGNVYAVGYTQEGFGGEEYRGGALDVFVAKFDEEGERIWVRLLGSADVETATAVATDGAESVYVAGSTAGAIGGNAHNGGPLDGFVAKYGPDGTRSWVRTVGGEGRDFVDAVAVGPGGEVHLAGAASQGFGGTSYSGGDYDAFYATYDPLGMRKAVGMFGGSGAEQGNGAAVDGAGNLYVSGWTTEAFGGGEHLGAHDAYLARIGSDGQPEWIDFFGTEGDDEALGLAAGGESEIYVCGGVSDGFDGASYSGGMGDAFVARYDSSGQRRWVRLLGTSGWDGCTGVAVDSSGAPFTVGFAAGELEGASFQGGEHDVVVSGYGADGAHRWSRLSGTSGADLGVGITAGRSGAIYAGGEVPAGFDGEEYAGGDFDGFVLKLE